MLSISIVTYRADPALLGPVLDSLGQALDGLWQRWPAAQVELDLVDNGDQADELLALLANHFPQAADPETLIQGQDQAASPPPTERLRIRLHSGHGNVGYGRGHNRGIRLSRQPFHLILNPDVLLAPDALCRGLSYLEMSPQVVALSPAATDGEGRCQYLCKRYPAVWDLLLRGFGWPGLKRRYQARLARYEMREMVDRLLARAHDPMLALESVPIISGCFMLCRREALEAVGGFDEGYFLYFEDFALSLALARQGRLALLPSMRIQHFGGHSARKGLRHIAYFLRSGLRFFNQHGWKWR